jgi:hypothetical protein
MRKTTQIEAKKGDCVDTYESQEAFEKASKRMEIAAKRLSTKRELVYITIPMRHRVMWQVYLLP